MNHPWTDRLSEYLDGELEPKEAVELERHLAGCAECRKTTGDLLAVVRRAETLPDGEPGRDLWPAIEAGIRARRGVPAAALRSRPPRRRFTFSVPEFAAAAVLLMSVAAGFTWWMSGLGSGADVEPRVAVNEARPAALVRPAAATIAQSSYDDAIRELQTVLEQREGNLDSSTVRIIRENLARIDRAIGQARAALATDPRDPYLTEHLSETMRRKLDLLRRAADLSAART